MTDWLEYQKLAAQIYAELEPYAQVKHDDKIMGQDSKVERQIDVSLRFNLAGHDILIIVQARNRKRRVDVNAVGEFASVMQDVRATKGVLISNAGFTKTAVTLASRYNIDLCSLHDVRTPQWWLSITLPLLWIENRVNVEIQMQLQKQYPLPDNITWPADASQWKFSKDAGQSRYDLFGEFALRWNKMELPRSLDQQHQYIPDIHKLSLQVALGHWWPVKELSIGYRVFRDGWLGAVQLSDCRGIMNRVTDTLRARVKITNKDVPVSKNPSWKSVETPDLIEANAQNLFVVECPEISTESLKLTRFASE